MRYDLVFDGPLLERLAIHLTKGAEHYSPRNWMKASGQEELERFKESAARHFVQWYRGDTDEDHMAAVVFNLNGYEYVKEKLDAVQPNTARETVRAASRIGEQMVLFPLDPTSDGPEAKAEV